MLSIFYFDEITPLDIYLRFILKMSRFCATNDTLRDFDNSIILPMFISVFLFLIYIIDILYALVKPFLGSKFLIWYFI